MPSVDKGSVENQSSLYSFGAPQKRSAIARRSLSKPPAALSNAEVRGETSALSESELRSSTLRPIRPRASAQRPQVISRGKRKLPVALPRRRRQAAKLALAGLVLAIGVSTLLAVVPIANGNGRLFMLANSSADEVGGQASKPNFLTAQQAATATVVSRAGSGVNSNAGVPTMSPSMPAADTMGSTLWRFPSGQCTYWADLRYHQLTGYWVNWRGNAYQWMYGAASNGWIVSASPHVPSIVVLQPGVDSAGSVGHVAVVESLNGNGTVHTSDYNWGSPMLSHQDFAVGPGVAFLWHP